MIRKAAWLMVVTLAAAIPLALVLGITLMPAVIIALVAELVVWEVWDVQMERRREG